MARSKIKSSPDQLSFNFDVMIDHVTSLREELEAPDKENAYDNRTNKTIGNSGENFKGENNSTNRQSIELFPKNLFDFGSLGAQSAGRIENAGTAGQGSNDVETLGADLNGGERPIEPASFTDETFGNVRLGDSGENGHTDKPVNFRITESDQIGKGGAKAKFADNIEAIRILKKLQSQNSKTASHEEQRQLAKYVGWGGLAQAFDPSKDKWNKEYFELKNCLSADEYSKARRSTQDAHYT